MASVQLRGYRLVGSVAQHAQGELDAQRGDEDAAFVLVLLPDLPGQSPGKFVPGLDEAFFGAGQGNLVNLLRRFGEGRQTCFWVGNFRSPVAGKQEG